MARRSYASSTLRYVQPRYYIKRPKRLAFLFFLCISLTWFVYDRQSLNKEHQEDILRLKREVSRLQNTLEVIKGNIKGSEESIQNDENNFTEAISAENDDPISLQQKEETIQNDENKFTQGTSADDDAISLQRREKVKEAMLHAWTSYEKYAWGMDELKPQSMSGVDSFGGLGATIVDSLDTLFIMGLDTQFKRAREWIAKSLYFNKNIEVSVFETTIRVLGGLLSAYDLSGDEVFLDKARDIADRLLPAWNTPSGIPYNRINLLYGNANNPRWTRGNSILADSGSEQLEFIALSQRTNDPKYQQKAEKVIRELHRTFPEDGLLPIYLNPLTGTKSSGAITFGAMGDRTFPEDGLLPSYLTPLTGTKSSGAITFGAMGDSFYEYLLKAWIQGNKTELVKFYREMWESSMKGLQSLIKKSTPSSFVYITERLGTAPFDKMDELACFVPGMLALGSSGYGTGGDKFMSLAEELAWTCYNFYQSTPTKLAGENYYFRKGEDMSVGTSWNIQRPETIESLFYLWRFTKNKTYQEWGWNIFEAFENNSRIETGYVGLKDVTTGVKDNMMQSFFLAETLKYLYLLFSPPSVIPLDEWVFNTEAHPLRIVTRNVHQEGPGLSVDQEDKIPRHLHGRKEGRMDYK